MAGITPVAAFNSVRYAVAMALIWAELSEPNDSKSIAGRQVYGSLRMTFAK